MSAIAAKWISSFVLFGATLVVSILPVIVFNYFTKIKKKKRNQYNINNTFNISSPLSSSNQRTTTNINNLSSNIDDNESVTGSGENVIRRTRSNSITSISSISSRKLNKKSAKILQIFMFFGGGVLLATSFCHLIPEIKENFEKYQHRDHNHSVKNRLLKPFSNDYSDEINTDLSIETTTLPDLLLFNKRNLTDLPLPSSLHAHPHSHEDDPHEIEHTTTNPNGDEEETNESNAHAHKHDNLPWVEIAICGGFFFIYLLEELIHTFVHNHSHGLDEQHNNTFKSETIDDINWELPYQSKTDSDTHLVNNSSNKSLPCYDNYAIDFNSEPQLVREQIAKRKSIEQEENSIRNNRINQNATTEDKRKLLPVSVRFVQGLVIIGAFSAHSIFDGLAIGLQSSTTQIYTMLFAISMHKLVVAFAVGLELYDQTCSVYMTSILMALFSVMSPIGVWIVIFSQKSTGIVSEDQSLLLIMLNAVACGTIIYIVFFEILQKDRSGSHVNGVLLWIVMFSGFMLMLSVNIFVVG